MSSCELTSSFNKVSSEGDSPVEVSDLPTSDEEFLLYKFNHNVPTQQNSFFSAESLIHSLSTNSVSTVRDGLTWTYTCYYDLIADGNYQETYECNGGGLPGLSFAISNEHNVGAIFWDIETHLTPGQTVEFTIYSDQETNFRQINNVTYLKRHAPTITNISNQSTDIDTPTGAIAFTINDVDSSLDCSTSVTMTSSNTTLIDNTDVVFGGTAPNCTAVLTPNAGETGSSTITFIVEDETGQTESEDFFLTVTDPGACADLNMSLTFNATLNNTNARAEIITSSGVVMIDWGDGTDEPINGEISHTYSTSGTKNILVHGCLENITTLSLWQVGGPNAPGKFTGNLPDLSNLTNLDTLLLSFNQFTGGVASNEFVNNTQLRVLSMSYNSLGGTLPSGVFDTNTLLENLNFTGCNMIGSLPTGIFDNNTALKDLYFGGDPVYGSNNFSGSLDSSLFDNNTLLEKLEFQYNDFSGSLPSNIFANNSQLKRLSFSYNNFTGGLPAGVFDSNTLLDHLSFDQSFQSPGALPAGVFDNNTLLDYLSFRGTPYYGYQFTGALPSGVFDNNTLLTTLDFRGNGFSGTLPSGVFDNNTQLDLLWFSENSFSGAIDVDVFDNNTILTSLDFDNNNFSGNLPVGLFDNNTALERLSFSSNSFSGSLPAGIFDNNTLLEWLYFPGNDFNGVIPSGLFDNNTDLITLSFHSNHFSGAMPAGLFDNNTLLRNLYFYDNQLTSGTSLVNNVALRQFDASSNYFSVSAINNFLIDLEASSAPGGNGFNYDGFIMDNQSPSAPPSGTGLTAKNNMVADGINVETD